MSSSELKQFRIATTSWKKEENHLTERSQYAIAAKTICGLTKKALRLTIASRAR
jgi:hypothetical protein